MQPPKRFLLSIFLATIFLVEGHCQPPDDALTDTDPTEYFTTLLEDFQPVMLTGYPDMGLPPVDPYQFPVVTAHVALQNNDTAGLTLTNGVQSGGANWSLESLSVQTLDNRTFNLTFQANTHGLRISSDLSLLGVFDGAVVSGAGSLSLNISLLEEFYLIIFIRTGVDRYIVDWCERDVFYRAGDASLSLEGLPDDVADELNENVDTVTRQIFHYVDYDFYNSLFTLFNYYNIQQNATAGENSDRQT